MTTSKLEVILVPTAKAAPLPRREIDPISLTDENLRSLKSRDPFMYHSIPVAHRAELLPGLSLSEMPEEATVVRASSRKVSRKSRVSTERHISFLFEQIVGDEIMHSDNGDTPGEPETDLIDLLRAFASSSGAGEQDE